MTQKRKKLPKKASAASTYVNLASALIQLEKSLFCPNCFAKLKVHFIKPITNKVLFYRANISLCLKFLI
jgi:hypothetical protein